MHANVRSKSLINQWSLCHKAKHNPSLISRIMEAIWIFFSVVRQISESHSFITSRQPVAQKITKENVCDICASLRVLILEAHYRTCRLYQRSHSKYFGSDQKIAFKNSKKIYFYPVTTPVIQRHQVSPLFRIKSRLCGCRDSNPRPLALRIASSTTPPCITCVQIPF